ncbi:hypothetical protein HAX54_037578, partial [Datura stramonium]|nr:hypothetical protein [Datura stramonium]
ICDREGGGLLEVGVGKEEKGATLGTQVRSRERTITKGKDELFYPPGKKPSDEIERLYKGGHVGDNWNNIFNHLRFKLSTRSKRICRRRLTYDGHTINDTAGIDNVI